MKRILMLFVGLLFLFSCELTINEDISTQYLIDGMTNGDLDIYLQGTQIFRYKGKPGVETIPIGNENLSQYERCFILHVATGTTAETIVSSAIIKLDGLEVLNTSDFSKNGGEHTFEVCDITETSSITVEVRGQPGSYIEIWIEGKKIGCPSTVTDVDGNVYNVVKIGDQCWMKENLKTTKYRDGSSILNITNPDEWVGVSTGAYCWWGNNESMKDSPYGALYNAYTLTDKGGICPTGWHLPTDGEWDELINFLGGNSVAGGHLKEVGYDFWNSPNPSDNSSGFSGIGAGYRYGPSGNGAFNQWHRYAEWWAAPESPEAEAYYRAVFCDGIHVDRNPSNKNYGFTIRCIKDPN